MKPLISVIAPMYNEESVVDEYCNTVLSALQKISEKYDYEIILVNDGSVDNTLQIMKKNYNKNPGEISIVNLSRNFGLEGAVHAGLSKAQGEIIVTMDADLQDPPMLILEMLKEYENGADIVSGRRIKRDYDNFLKRFSAKIFNKIFKSFSGRVKLEENVSFYRLFSQKVLNQLLELPEKNIIFRVTLPFLGMKNTVIGYERNKRFAGKSKYDLFSLVRYSLDALTSISIEPLRKIAMIIPLLFFIFIVSLIGAIVLRNSWQTVFVFIALTSFITLLNGIVLSVMSEYLAQIMIEVKHRPISIIYDYIPSGNCLRREKIK